MKGKVFLSLAVLILLISSAFAQVNVNGKVLDDRGQPLPGATVLVKSTKKGTTTNADGSFTLAAKPGTKLMVSAIGYDTYEVSGGSNMMVRMNVDTKTLTDVVVTGVGVATSRKKVAIDVASVSSKDFAKSATGSIEQALTGQIAGAQITQTSGQPGSAYNIILRGINDLGGLPPMFLLDGVQVLDISSLDPATVDHIEVVKGASGATIYGAQGANGVIQIFTKKGTINGKLSITASSKVSVDQVLHGHDILAKYHYYNTDANGTILDVNGKPIARDATGSWTDPGTPDLQGHPETVNNKTYNIPTFNHLDQAFRQALTLNNSISLTGGGNSIDYAFTASRLDQQDVFSNKYIKDNLGLNLGFQLFKGFTLRTTTAVTEGKNNLLNGNRFEVLNAYPWVDLNFKDSTGHRAIKTSNSSNQNNSLSEQEWHQRNFTNFNIAQNFNANYKVNRFVELDYKYGINYANNEADNLYLNQSNDLQTSLHWGPDRQGSLSNAQSKETFKNSLATMYVRADFQKDFHLNIPIKSTTQVAYDYRDHKYTTFFAQGIQLPIYPPNNIGSAQIKNSGDGPDFETKTFGVLVNQTFDYANLMGISAGFRADYGSEFGAGQKASTFPRASIYFRPSELMGHNIITDWKLRAVYGEAGIQPQPYTRQVTLDVNTLGNSVGLSLPTVAHNPYLQIQVSKELEVGTDISFNILSGNWLHKATLNGSYWTRKGNNIIQNADASPSSGFASRIDNLASVASKGVDISLDLNVYNSPNIVWNMLVRYGKAESKIVNISNGLDIIAGDFALKAGQPIGLFYGQTPLHSITQLKPDGKTPYISAANQQFYTIVDGNVVDTRTNMVLLTGSNDKSVIGNAFPKFNASLINNITFFKKLSLSFQFDWKNGGNIYNQTRQWLYSAPGGSGGSGGVSSDFDKPVTINGKTGAFVNYYQSFYNIVQPVSWFVEDGSFVRLRDLSITYDFTSAINQKWFKRLSLTASGRNLLTWTKYTGLDPENTTAVDSQGNAISGLGSATGVDYFGIPNLRSYQLTINLGF